MKELLSIICLGEAVDVVPLAIKDRMAMTARAVPDRIPRQVNEHVTFHGLAIEPTEDIDGCFIEWQGYLEREVPVD